MGFQFLFSKQIVLDICGKNLKGTQYKIKYKFVENQRMIVGWELCPHLLQVEVDLSSNTGNAFIILSGIKVENTQIITSS